MADLLLDEQAAPASPGAGSVVIYPTNDANPLLATKDDGGFVRKYLADLNFAAKGDLLSASAAGTPSTLTVGANGKTLAALSSATAGLKWVDPVMCNFSVGTVIGFAADTYLVGSAIAVPAGLVRAGTQYYCRFDMTKTGAGVATPIVNVRFGVGGSTADTARLTFTFAVGTAVVDTGIVEIWVHWRNIGAVSVLVGVCRITHHLAATGLTTTGASGTAIITAVSGTFDSTVANSIIGVSFNGGAAFSGTNVLVQSETRELNV